MTSVNISYDSLILQLEYAEESGNICHIYTLIKRIISLIASYRRQHDSNYLPAIFSAANLAGFILKEAKIVEYRNYYKEAKELHKEYCDILHYIKNNEIGRKKIVSYEMIIILDRIIANIYKTRTYLSTIYNYQYKSFCSTINEAIFERRRTNYKTSLEKINKDNTWRAQNKIVINNYFARKFGFSPVDGGLCYKIYTYFNTMQMQTRTQTQSQPQTQTQSQPQPRTQSSHNCAESAILASIYTIFYNIYNTKRDYNDYGIIRCFKTHQECIKWLDYIINVRAHAFNNLFRNNDSPFLYVVRYFENVIISLSQDREHELFYNILLPRICAEAKRLFYLYFKNAMPIECKLLINKLVINKSLPEVITNKIMLFL